MALRATVHDDPGSLTALGPAWDALAAEAGRPASLSAWMLAWARHVGTGPLRVATVHEGTDLLGVLPFMLVRDAAGTRRLRLLGSGVTTTIEPLARQGREHEVARAGAEALDRRRPRADALDLEGVPAASPWPGLLAGAWPRARPRLRHRELVLPEPLVRLEQDDFEGWMATRSGNFRSQVRRARRALSRAGGSVRRSADPAQLDRDLAAFLRLHEARWESRGGSGVIGVEVQAILADAGPALLVGGHLDLWCVEVGGEVVGAQLWLRAGVVTTMWLSGSDDAHAALRPAMLIMAAAVEDGFDRGLSTVSLGSGGQDYKRRFAGEEVAVEWWVLPLLGPRLALTLGEVEIRRARRELGRRLGEERKARLRGLVGRASGGLPARSAD